MGWTARRFFPVAATRAYLLWIRLTRSGAARKYISDFVRSPSVPWFDHVEIETLNRCNGECDFCPVGRSRDPRPYGRMSEEQLRKIIGELAEIEYAGYLGLFSNNEPLLDTRLARFAALAREALPKAWVNLSTNGSLLDEDGLRRLLPFFDRIIVNNYHDRPAMRENVRRVYAFCRSPEGARLLAGRTLEISLRGVHDVLTTRAGASPNRPPVSRSLPEPCALPFSQLIIRPDGKVSLCCNDALGGMTLGDLSRQSVGEVWRGDACAKARETMLRSGRAGLPLCRGCDFVKHDVGRIG